MSWNQNPYQPNYQQDPYQTQQPQHHQHHHQQNQGQPGQIPSQQGQYQQPPQQQYQQQHYEQAPQQQQYQHGSAQRKKALLIGINYTGTANELQGCRDDVRNMTRFLVSKGYPTDEKSMVTLTDDRQGHYSPTGQNILGAMDWLVSEPNTTCFLHYSGHGSQVKDPDGDRDSGFDDTIVPLDFEENGQLDSDTLHRHIVSRLSPSSSLFVVFDCCHSGSAIELPFVYRSDADGNVSLVDNVKQGIHLVAAARNLLQGGFTMSKAQDAKQLLAGAQSFFHSLKHRSEPREEGLGEEHFMEDWNTENKNVCMYSGCRDDQTASDASIAGEHVGAMSWAFLQTMQQNSNQSYIEVLQNTRGLLKGRYKQIPQLSVGRKMDLNQPLII